MLKIKDSLEHVSHLQYYPLGIFVGLAEIIAQETPKNAFFDQAFRYRKRALLDLKEKLKDLKETVPVDFLSSLLHMHCNRLMGIDQNKELKAYLYAEHTIKAMKKKCL